MRIVFSIYNLVPAKLPLQPWLSMSRIATALGARGHSVFMMTDVPDPAEVEGVEVHSVSSLRGSNTGEVRELLARIRPDALVFLPTPLNIVTASWLDGLECRRVGFASFSYYNATELGIALRRLPWSEVRQYARHLLIPRLLWKRAMHRRLNVLVTQSQTTADRLAGELGGRPPARCIPPGIDLSDWQWHAKPAAPEQGTVKLLYLGAAVEIRGFDVALDAMRHVSHPNVQLRVLARGADRDMLTRINNQIARRHLQRSVSVEGGWIGRDRLIEEIHLADAVLQPFVLVPSELPVTAMEVIACGTPVIGSKIDGMPSTIGPAGTVVKQGDASSLAEAIDQFAGDLKVREVWRAGCRQRRDAMLDWGRVVDEWEALLHG